ncbi:MAG TPA: tetratricopeptide repeat protein [Verrucomicrobiae bacterium]|nr:tetratricopeptide repeat protein [Verrucomicrobiae bacterium]
MPRSVFSKHVLGNQSSLAALVVKSANAFRKASCYKVSDMYRAVALFVVSMLTGARLSAQSAVTFNKDIAPLVFEHCAGCHRSGQSGPFPLLTYSEVKAKRRKIGKAIEAREMPPWLPAGEFGQFLGDRRLSSEQIEVFQQWLGSGMPEGAPGDLPPRPKWDEEWQLGKPDLVVQMPKKFRLQAGGQDVYRNFVIPVPLQKPRYVRAVEFEPDNRRIVHHAFVRVDSSGEVRRLEGTEGQPGFEGMTVPESVKMPSGYFLSYQPGKMPAAEPPGFGWTLNPGQDLVVQMHLRPTGQPEELQARVGLYFTDIPPTNTTMVFALSSLTIDLPPEATNCVVEDSFTMPVDGELLSVLPHTHYLGKRLEGMATLPDGKTQQLLLIPNWDFNWQGDYRYSHPVHVPAGTLLQMRYVFDNSAANPANPNRPTREVLCGPQSSDEMAELWFQVLLHGTNDATRLADACNEKNIRMFAGYDQFRLKRNPRNAKARSELGFTQWTHGQVQQAMESFREAAADDPTFDQPHYYLGVIYRTQNKLLEAQTELEKAIQLNPKNARAYGNLAFVFWDSGKLERAERSIRAAVKLDPTDRLARETLDKILQLRASANGH